jgi:hypothetical protein
MCSETATLFISINLNWNLRGNVTAGWVHSFPPISRPCMLPCRGTVQINPNASLLRPDGTHPLSKMLTLPCNEEPAWAPEIDVMLLLI